MLINILAFNFKKSKRIIVKVPIKGHKDGNQFSTYEEISHLCKVENEFKSQCRNCSVITKAMVYKDILGKTSCSQVLLLNLCYSNKYLISLLYSFLI